MCDKYFDDCDIIIEIERYRQPSIFELGRLDSFNGCPDLTQTQAEMGIKLRFVVEAMINSFSNKKL